MAIEAKGGSVALAKISRELDDARHNRGAAVAVTVFHVGCAPTGCAPLTLHGEHVIWEADPDDPDDAALETAIRLGRALAIASLRDRSGTVNLGAVHTALDQYVDTVLDALTRVRDDWVLWIEVRDALLADTSAMLAIEEWAARQGRPPRVVASLIMAHWNASITRGHNEYDDKYERRWDSNAYRRRRRN